MKTGSTYTQELRESVYRLAKSFDEVKESLRALHGAKADDVTLDSLRNVHLSAGIDNIAAVFGLQTESKEYNGKRYAILYIQELDIGFYEEKGFTADEAARRAALLKEYGIEA